jgi:TRAP-type C4-dicarboxylate transport system substrate-binding protein
MEIKLIGGFWLVNGKRFNELTPNEKVILDQFFEELKNYKL